MAVSKTYPGGVVMIRRRAVNPFCVIVRTSITNKRSIVNTGRIFVQLEQEQGIPRNPFINAGALVVT